MTKKNILITGTPGSGKTTLIQRIAHELHGLRPVGFYTTEIRINGIRQGFELVSLSGERGILAHVTIRGPHRVGKYGVDIAGFEKFLEALTFQDTPHSPVIIDEIGKMECISPKFRKMMEDALLSDAPLVATIALKGDRFIEGIKERRDVELIHLTIENRQILLAKIVEKVQEFFKKADG